MFLKICYCGKRVIREGKRKSELIIYKIFRFYKIY